ALLPGPRPDGRRAVQPHRATERPPERVVEAGLRADRGERLLEGGRAARGAQSPQSKSRERVQSPLSSAAPTESVSEPGHAKLACATTSGSIPSSVSSRRACSSVLNSGWLSNGSSDL